LKQVLKERISVLGDIDGYVGKYFSEAWVRKHVLRQTEDDIEQMDKEIEEERAEGDDDDEEDNEPQQPQAQAPVPVIVQNQNEEVDSREIDDTDQKELAKSMTKFFDTLVEEAKGDDKEAK
jgi:uncharacterized UPF0160 family protein